MIVVDLRGEDRTSGHIRGTVHVPAMDLLKQIQTYVEEFRHQPIVAFFCQYSAHRAPTVAGCILTYCNNIHACCTFSFSDFKSCNKTLSKATVSAGGNQSNKVANFYRKSCPSKQRVMILEGGFRGWEAHDLPVQQMEATLSQEACDELAVKLGKGVAQLTG